MKGFSSFIFLQKVKKRSKETELWSGRPKSESPRGKWRTWDGGGRRPSPLGCSHHSGQQKQKIQNLTANCLSSVCIPWACSPLSQPCASPGHTGCRAGRVTLSREARMDKQHSRACSLSRGNDPNRSHAQDEDKTCIFHTLHKN